MSTIELERRLTGSILDALREHAFSPPATRDPAIREPYFADMVQAVMDRIKAAGWLFAPPSTRWRDDGDSAPRASLATPAELEDDLRLCVCFALTQYPHKPPRTRDSAVTERYHSAVATAVVKQISLLELAAGPDAAEDPASKMALNTSTLKRRPADPWGIDQQQGLSSLG